MARPTNLEEYAEEHGPSTVIHIEPASDGELILWHHRHQMICLTHWNCTNCIWHKKFFQVHYPEKHFDLSIVITLLSVELLSRMCLRLYCDRHWIQWVWSGIVPQQPLELSFMLPLFPLLGDKQRVLTPGHQGWNDLHSLCRIGMEYHLLNMYLNATVCHIIMVKSHHVLSY